MITFSAERKHELFTNFRDKKILVLGDLMLDRYLWGTVARISPEAPVPVVEIDSEATRLGGAANVAHNLAALGGIAIPVGVVGDDANGDMLTGIFQRMNFNIAGIVKDPTRMTSVKTRIIAHNQHVVRTDRESKTPINRDIMERLIQKVQELIDECDAVIFQDYNKGLLIPELIARVIKTAREQKKIITVDPKFDNFFQYTQVTVFKPNKKETEEALGMRVFTESDLANAIRKLKERLTCTHILITLGEKGMCLLEESDELTIIPTKAQQVHDVSGAGDTVISTLTMALVAGASMKEATTLANYAAGVVCKEIGVVPIYLNQLMEAVQV